MKKKILALTLAATLTLSSTSVFASTTTCTESNYDLNNLENYISNLDNEKTNITKMTVNGNTVDLNSIDWKSILNNKTTSPAETKQTAAKPAATQSTAEKPTATQSTVTKPSVTQTTSEKPAATQQAAPSNTEVSSSVSSYEQKVVELVNVERQKAGLSSLSLDTAISNVARMKSKDMATNNYFAHQSPTYGSAGDMLTKYGIKWSAWGENIASGQRTPQEVVTAWMNSPGHKANIMSTNFSKLGVGYAVNSNGTPYWTQMFTN
ncbi:putative YkwD family protein [Sedimentibacter acidaminivorans]|uniref:YkwD family protein n=1 Tax=Sedimentibacter acidaminivorans TaxID=913099 RepID=A0ABS4GBQ3_9FIRM|nr:CAP domain-containing protein [Sedimentibacter acidaminivorans]MBP1925121.1 putative YkwD family protein [Sedimentibacter acidaminivorans]